MPLTSFVSRTSFSLADIFSKLANVNLVSTPRYTTKDVCQNDNTNAILKYRQLMYRSLVLCNMANLV